MSNTEQLAGDKSDHSLVNGRVFLSARPGAAGIPKPEHFGYEECPYPADLKEGEVLVRTLCLSVDPLQRCLMNEDAGVSYAKSWQIRETVMGYGAVGVVKASKHPDYRSGELVQSMLDWPWMNYFVVNVESAVQYSLMKVDAALLPVVREKPSLLLTLLGMTGLTSVIGIQQKGGIKAGSGQTCVVSGAAGACGSLAGQFARLEGCQQVVGICGSDQKCQWLVQDLGFDAAINYKTENVSDRLAALCSRGVDVYFDNVGGTSTDAVISHMNHHGNIVLCGAIADYNKDQPYPPVLSEDVQQILKERQITRDRYTVINYPHLYQLALQQLTQWWTEGKVKVRETVAEGLESAGQAFCSMMSGGNIGKQIIHVSDL